MSSAQASALLFDIALILLVAHAFGALAKRFGQPSVVGEIAAGVLLGPTLLDGWIAATLFPADVRPLLSALANVGIALFMFLVGLEFDRKLIAGKGAVMATVATAGVLLPFGLGAALALHLAQAHPTRSPLGFVLFLGIAMAATAFPVLARILSERGMSRTAMGGLALGCAAVIDVIVWSMLAAVVVLVGTHDGEFWRMALAVPYVVAMLTVVRPLLRKLGASPRWRRNSVPLLLVGVLVSGGFTEWIGLHFAFGAFFLGFVVPRTRDDTSRTELTHRMEHVSALLLPMYFVMAGLQVDLTSLGWTGFADLGLIMVVAVGGKFAGVYLAARLHRVSATESVALATLLNTRGLTELVILTIGRELGLLDPPLYSAMVVMTLITTAMTGPMLTLLDRTHRRTPDLTGRPG